MHFIIKLKSTYYNIQISDQLQKNEYNTQPFANQQFQQLQTYTISCLQTYQQVDQIIQSIKNSSSGINEKMLERIITIQTNNYYNSANSSQWKSGINSLKFFLKFALKNQYTSKALNAFLNQKTLLQAQLIQYICKKYQQISLQQIQPPKQAKLEQISWSACNLKQGKNNQIVNKMYMKLYLRTLQNGEEQEKVINCQLPEFKLILSQITQVNSNMR